MRKSSIAIGIIVILILAVIIIGYSLDKSEDVIKIGFIGPLTGEAAVYGIPIQQVIELAAEEINNLGWINNKNLEIIYEDGKCTGKDSASAMQKLINIDMVKVVLSFCSGETLGAAPIAEENKVILFSSGSGSPDITQAGDYIFRNFPSDTSSGSKVAQAAIKNGHKRISIITEQTDYAEAIKNVFKKTFEEAGGVILIDESIASDTNDFRTEITKIKNSNPDAIYAVTQTPIKFGLLLKQLKELDVNKQIYTNEHATAENILKDYPSKIENAIYAEPQFDENSIKVQELLNKIKIKYGSVVKSLPPVYFATSYDAVYILKEAIEECSEDTNCIKNHLYSIKDRQGVADLLSIDKNGDAVFEYVLKTIKNGKAVEYTYS